MSDYTVADLAKMIDHSLLNPIFTQNDFEKGIAVALEYNVASVCIMPYYLKRCAELLKGSTVKASTVIAFPHGGQVTSVKLAEAKQALDDGCEEFDLVVNISQVLSGNWNYVQDDIAPVIELAHGAGQTVKVIFENCYLSDAQKIKLCEICAQLKADWVKTSTGYGTSGATIADLELMRKHSPDFVQVKAAGGIRELDMLLAVRKTGATRCGCSKTAEVLQEAARRLAAGV
ncbi:deoxyribose-phosphate aldolase [Pirellula staleyi DSM 6068]|uniref:Deoxyribose-phosphate aldolase n=1 Tax=Pirellula staleyi (strain ATCC 27377 / DSM 6068 / ICPB 4128) TaxID=530564 RepID=D2R096_PIRSD|nr:deoxyribose-phosphate aldolase [Pirellula staleyi]ADB14764.1 deoxyribose-phosphate aldolase [Pirellula staleyi DSM 6068]